MFNPNPKITQWEGRRVWLIGASSGIGEALTRRLQSAGARLALSARNAEKLNRLATGNDLVLPLDVQELDALNIAHQRIIESWDGLDLMIYCAGVYTPMKSEHMELKPIEQAIAINLSGAFRAVHTVVPNLLLQGAGGICLLGSIAGFTGLPRSVAYGPTKSALINMAQTLYTELHPKGIGVYLVNPGFVDTRLTQKNDFEMPALITTEQAATSVLEGFSKGNFEIHFPKRFSLFLKFISVLPDLIRFRILSRLDP